MTRYNFQIEHGDFRALLQLTETQTLYQLAETIIEAVGFQFDHAFGFYSVTKGRRKSEEEYTLFADMEDSDEDNPGVKNTRVDSVFTAGKKIIFLFDYGDEWMFDVTCLSLETATRNLRRPKIAETSGTPPDQYGEWSEDDEE